MRARALEAGGISATPRRIHTPDVARTRGYSNLHPYTCSWPRARAHGHCLSSILIRRRHLRGRRPPLRRSDRSDRVDQLAQALASRPLRDLDIYVSAGRQLPHRRARHPRLADDGVAEPTRSAAVPLSARDPSALRHSRDSEGPSGSERGLWVPRPLRRPGFARSVFSAPWTALFLLWPPIFSGLWAGNVAAVTFGLFALGPWRADALVASTVFKLYNAVTLLWGRGGAPSQTPAPPGDPRGSDRRGRIDAGREPRSLG